MPVADRSNAAQGIDRISGRGTLTFTLNGALQTLWSAWVITSVNGRSGTPLGRARCQPASTIAAALLNLAHHKETPALSSIPTENFPPTLANL
jgi:hypothetical protein